MGEHSKIEWTDHTFNPWWGCTRVSPGCEHCYAEAIDRRYHGGRHWGPGSSRLIASRVAWSKPLAWNKRAKKRGRVERVFCASMGDVFEDHEDVRGVRRDLWMLIRKTPWLIWMLLTKRTENIIGMLPLDWCDEGPDGYHNVWIGTTVEDQRRADERVPALISVPAQLRFLSCEPLLGPVDLTRALGVHGDIGWVIAGGESGSGARPMHPDWARQIRDQCFGHGVPFFFKQWGAHEVDWERASDPGLPRRDVGRYVDLSGGHGEHGGERIVHVRRVRDAGRELDGRTWDQIPATPAPEVSPW